MDKPDGKTNKKVWTDDERLKLAEQLDAELEDYINKMGKRAESNKTEEKCPYENLIKELEQHPFFMTEMPENPNEMSPLVEGLQQLKYSEEYNTPNELALSYKEDGNFNYKYKKYHLAILNFSKGISTKCTNVKLLAELYNNRALAHLKLKNYNSSLKDCKKSLELQPSYFKSLHTAAVCSFHVKKYDECIDYCQQIQNMACEDQEVKSFIGRLRADSVKSKKLTMRDSRLQKLMESKTEQMRSNVLEAIKSRNIKVDYSDLFDLEHHVHLDDANMLIWPVIFAYPERNQYDLVQNFNESTIFHEELIEIFKTPPSWDDEKRYQIDNLRVYFEDDDKKLYKVETNRSLKQILQHKSFVVKNGTPWFFIVIADSKCEEHFLKNNR